MNDFQHWISVKHNNLQIDSGMKHSKRIEPFINSCNNICSNNVLQKCNFLQWLIILIEQLFKSSHFWAKIRRDFFCYKTVYKIFPNLPSSVLSAYFPNTLYSLLSHHLYHNHSNLWSTFIDQAQWDGFIFFYFKIAHFTMFGTQLMITLSHTIVIVVTTDQLLLLQSPLVGISYFGENSLDLVTIICTKDPLQSAFFWSRQGEFTYLVFKCY